LGGRESDELSFESAFGEKTVNPKDFRLDPSDLTIGKRRSNGNETWKLFRKAVAPTEYLILVSQHAIPTV
jgi:hypothetical protein